MPKVRLERLVCRAKTCHVTTYCLNTRSFRKDELEGILVCKDCNAKGETRKDGL